MLVFSKEKFIQVEGLEKNERHAKWVDEIEGVQIKEVESDGWGKCHVGKNYFYVHTRWCKEV